MDMQISSNNTSTDSKVVEMRPNESPTQTTPATTPFLRLAELISTAKEEIKRESDTKVMAINRAQGDKERANQAFFAAGKEHNDIASRLENGRKPLNEANHLLAKLSTHNPLRSQLEEVIAAAKAEQSNLRVALNAAKQRLDLAKQTLENAEQELATLEDHGSALPEESALTRNNGTAHASVPDTNTTSVNAERHFPQMGLSPNEPEL